MIIIRITTITVLATTLNICSLFNNNSNNSNNNNNNNNNSSSSSSSNNNNNNNNNDNKNNNNNNNNIRIVTLCTGPPGPTVGDESAWTGVFWGES